MYRALGLCAPPDKGTEEEPDENATPKRKGTVMAAMYKDIQHGALTGRRRKSAEGHLNERKMLRAVGDSSSGASGFKRAHSMGGTRSSLSGK